MGIINLLAILIETLIADYLFALRFTRRKLFWLRFIGYGIVAAVITVWIPIAYTLISGKDFAYGNPAGSLGDSIFNLIFYCLIFLMTCIICVLSYKQRVMQIFFCCSGAYAVQHISRNLLNLFLLIPFFGTEGAGKICSYVLMAAVYTAIYILAYFILIKPQKNENVYEGNNKRKIAISFIIVVICIVMSRLTSDNAARDILSVIAESIYAILCSMLVLYIQFAISENDSMRLEMDSMAEILRIERKQFELSKETIDIINIKCHDMKHQIAALRTNASDENIAEIERAIMIYDSTIKTGNDTLDVILTEKKLYCEDKNIQMICVADGKRISFINDVDIYSLFGNALSNAIESVSKIPDEQKRCISINVIDADNLLFIHVENFFEGVLEFEDGLPVTQNDKNFHGFGIKSMERIVRKYGGEISAFTSGNKFNLDIVLPIPE